jgi:hypothetical protein
VGIGIQPEPGSKQAAVSHPSGEAQCTPGGTHRVRRSAVTNGKRLHVVRPGDTAWARRFRDVLDQIGCDLGGPEGLSEAQRQLARRAATISIMCEKLEGEAATGAKIDLNIYGMLTDRLGRCLQRLGLERVPRDITPVTLNDIARDLQGDGT